MGREGHRVLAEGRCGCFVVPGAGARLSRAETASARARCHAGAASLPEPCVGPFVLRHQSPSPAVIAPSRCTSRQIADQQHMLSQRSARYMMINDDLLYS